MRPRGVRARNPAWIKKGPTTSVTAASSSLAAMARVPTPRSVRILKRALQDPHPEIQFHAAGALSVMEACLNEEARAAEVQAARAPRPAAVKAQLGTRYFDYVYMGPLDPVGRRFYLDRAVQALSESIALDPRQPQVEVRLGRALIDRGDFRQAVLHLDRALEMDARSASAWLWRAEARYGLGDLAGALADARAASDKESVPETMQETVRWLTAPCP